MKEAMNTRISNAMRIAAREYAAKEHRGYIEAEWLQKNEVDYITTPRVAKFLDKAELQGYTSDDFALEPFLSTRGEWYGWIACRISHPLFGSITTTAVQFPERGDLPKDFVMPLYEKEQAEQKSMLVTEQAEEITRLRRLLEEYREENEALKELIIEEEDEEDEE